LFRLITLLGSVDLSLNSLRWLMEFIIPDFIAVLPFIISFLLLFVIFFLLLHIFCEVLIQFSFFTTLFLIMLIMALYFSYIYHIFVLFLIGILSILHQFLLSLISVHYLQRQYRKTSKLFLFLLYYFHLPHNCRVFNIKIELVYRLLSSDLVSKGC
jgi:hypothetical protein